MNEPLVSIVIPFYNNEATLLDTIKSVFIQTYQNWELILLNDGSNDKSLEIANSIKDKRVKVISDGNNRGLVYRLNQSPSLVKGDYIARMDGDDLMHPERIKKQMEVFLENSDVDLVDTGAYSIDELGNPIGIRGITAINHNPSYILKNAMLLHASVIGKKKWFEKYPYDPAYIRAEDRELWIRSYKTSIFARVEEPLYIVTEGKVNVNNYIKGLNTVIKIYRAYGNDIMPNFLLKLEIFKSYLKILVINILGFFNVHDVVTKRRNASLDQNDKIKVSDLIRKIKSFNVYIKE